MGTGCAERAQDLRMIEEARGPQDVADEAALLEAMKRERDRLVDEQGYNDQLFAQRELGCTGPEWSRFQSWPGPVGRRLSDKVALHFVERHPRHAALYVRSRPHLKRLFELVGQGAALADVPDG